MSRTQSTPRQRHIEPAVPQTVVRTIRIPALTVISIAAFACMALAILAALIGGGR